MICPSCKQETSSVLRTCQKCGIDIESFVQQQELEKRRIKDGKKSTIVARRVRNILIQGALSAAVIILVALLHAWLFNEGNLTIQSMFIGTAFGVGTGASLYSRMRKSRARDSAQEAHGETEEPDRTNIREGKKAECCFCHSTFDGYLIPLSALDLRQAKHILGYVCKSCSTFLCSACLKQKRIKLDRWFGFDKTPCPNSNCGQLLSDRKVLMHYQSLST